MKSSRKITLPVLGLILIAWIGSSILFSVSEIELVVVTQLGRPVRTISSPGLHAKWPDPIQSVMRFDARLLTHDTLPSEYLTADKKNVVVTNFICFRIQDPERFYRTVGTVEGAKVRLGDLVSSSTGAGLGGLPLAALLNSDPEKVQIGMLMDQVTRQCRETAEGFGIEVVDVRLRRLALPDQNLYSVFDRMRAERERIAKKYRAEGEEQAAKIRAEADREKREILAEASEEAERLRGEGDAEAARIYAGAYAEDPEFYRFLRTLEAYERFLGEKTTLVLSSDSELFSLIESQGD